MTEIGSAIVQRLPSQHASADAYYMIVDKLRSEDRRLVLEANEMHIGNKKKPDWKAFLVHILGLEKTKEVFKGTPQ